MLIHVFPQAAIIPVSSTDRNHCLICCQGIVVVDSPAGSLKSFGLLIAPNVVVQGSYCIFVYIICVVVNFLLVQLVFWMLIQTAAEAKHQRYCQYVFNNLLHAFSVLKLYAQPQRICAEQRIVTFVINTHSTVHHVAVYHWRQTSVARNCSKVAYVARYAQ